MKLLSIESSAKAASVSLTQGEALLCQYYHNSGLTHSRTLLPMADDLLKNMELTPADIDAIAVAVGPGSFTGIRIGVATAKGMAFAMDRPCFGVSTLEAMAWQGAHMGGIICPVMDARRNQVYNALFEERDGKLTRLTEDRAIAVEDLFCETRGKQLLLVGDGAKMCYNWLKERDELNPVKMLPENILYQSAWGVSMAAKYADPCSAHELKPNYIRLSQAERELLEREKN